MSPTLSVCIPTYNRGKLLKETLESIVAQANDSVEIVISDNASSDCTLEVVESFRGRIENLVYYRHPTNVGADLNYLKVAELASGEYIWLFGSDDTLLPGAIEKVFSELANSFDLYLGGLTLCNREMHPISRHHIINVKGQCEFDLSADEDRHDYFRRAMTTTAIFSFLGSIIVLREKWERSKLDPTFIGTLWTHAAKCFGILPHGLRLKVIDQSLLLKRGDNDSFMDQGLVHRIGVSVNGYLMIGRVFFGDESLEQREIKRVLRYEWPLLVYVSLYDRLPNTDKFAKTKLDELFDLCFDTGDLQGHLSRWTYKHSIGRILYRNFHPVAKRLTDWTRG